MREMLLNTSRREGAAGCKEEGNRLPASSFLLPAAGWFRLDTFGFISKNSIPIIGRLWRPPPIRLRRTPPYAGGRIDCPTLLLVSCSAKLSTHSPTSEAGGKVVASATKGGAADRRQTKWRRKAPYLANAVVLHNSRGRSPENRSGRRSRFRTEPLAPRAEGPAAPSTLAAKPRQPSGIPPSAGSSSKAHGIKYRTQQKAPVFRLVLFYYSCPCRASWSPWPCTP